VIIINSHAALVVIRNSLFFLNFISEGVLPSVGSGRCVCARSFLWRAVE
jgi:hypothetical protein